MFISERIRHMTRTAVLIATLLILGLSQGALGVEAELWGVFELTLKGPSSGNPFADVTLDKAAQT